MNKRRKTLERIRIDKISNTDRRVRSAVAELKKRRRRITVSSVSELSGISRTTIYNHPALKSLIEKEKRAQESTTHRRGMRRDLETREIELLRRKVGKLEGRVKMQSQMIEVLAEDGLIDL